MNYFALICARGGSKGVPHKNIKEINNHPLIAWSINLGKKNKRLKKLIVSTEDENIKKISKKYGAEILFNRPEELSQDNTPEWLVWKHAINFLESNNYDHLDALVILPATSPLRYQKDVDNALDLFEEGGCDAVISVKRASRNPYFNMTKINSKNFSEIVLKPDSNIFNRQNAPQIYDMATVVYVVSINHLKKNNHLFEGLVKQIMIPEERAIDIDNNFDFEIAEILLKKNNYKIEDDQD